MFEAAFSVILFSCLLGRLDCPDINPKTVKRGEKATLHCYGSTGDDVVIKWRKPGLQTEKENKQLYVLFVRENRTYEKHQLPSFRGRVQLSDPQMKDGDFTVIIRNVSMDDSGIYECYVGYDRGELKLINSTNLTVEEAGESGPTGGQSGDEGKKKDGGEERGSVGLIVGLSVLAVLIVAAVVVFIIYKNQPFPHDPVNTNEVIEMSPAAP